MAKRRYPIVIEKAHGTSYGVYSPDVPGCVSAGDTPEEALANYRDALAFHLESLHDDGQPAPQAVSRVDYVELDVTEAA